MVFFTFSSSFLIWTALEARITYSKGFKFLTCGLISCKTDISVNSPHFHTSWQRVQLSPSEVQTYVCKLDLLVKDVQEQM